MTLNRFMHPRNIYRSKPDFNQLAEDYPDFKVHLTLDTSGYARIDFKDPESLRSLTRCLLDRDFKLSVEIPSNRLIPTLPLRLNYILWIEDLLKTLPKVNNGMPVPVRGLDVGTGATCIYPLLGSKKNNWTFIATELDPEAHSCARRNVSTNNLDSFISVMLVAEDDDVFKVTQESDQLDFSMCNPPFFVSEAAVSSSGEEMTTDDSIQGSPKRKKKRVLAVPRVTDKHFLKHEGTTKGGELDFVTKMVQESLLLKEKIKIYTTMLGKKQNLLAIKKILRESGQTKSMATTEFCQGHQMRWGIAWTFLTGATLDLVKPIKRQKKSTEKSQMSKSQKIILPGQYEFPVYLQMVTSALQSLQFVFTKVHETGSSSMITCNAKENHWSHQRRQRRENLRRSVATSERTTVDNSEIVIDPVGCQMLSSEADDHNSITNREVPDVGTHKRAKLDSEGQDSVPAINVIVNLEMEGEAVVLYIHWLGGSLGFDAANQLMQYFKNKFK